MEEKREEGTDLQQQPRPRLSCRSQLGEQESGCGMTSQRTEGEVRSGVQRRLPTLGQERRWRP